MRLRLYLFYLVSAPKGLRAHALEQLDNQENGLLLRAASQRLASLINPRLRGWNMVDWGVSPR